MGLGKTNNQLIFWTTVIDVRVCALASHANCRYSHGYAQRFFILLNIGPCFALSGCFQVYCFCCLRYFSDAVYKTSGGATVFGARANVCVAAPANQISSAIRVFSGFRTWGVSSSPVPSHSLSSSPFSPTTVLCPTSSLPLKVGPLNPAIRPGGAL